MEWVKDIMEIRRMSRPKNWSRIWDSMPMKRQKWSLAVWFFVGHQSNGSLFRSPSDFCPMLGQSLSASIPWDISRITRQSCLVMAWNSRSRKHVRELCSEPRALPTYLFVAALLRHCESPTAISACEGIFRWDRLYRSCLSKATSSHRSTAKHMDFVVQQVFYALTILSTHATMSSNDQSVCYVRQDFENVLGRYTCSLMS